ncbi:prepilin-type N-terminal cleavage/methylation domain-containing protein [Massilia sp. RP-1-19]|uniref:Prepilin-type N-terminal cleavage/methylation domain-containing protein n=1 Tax=Massilia polaris TaxID=2728846 RepID=A0A848HL38_9BURK|nr:prepilin-type N-terminal cleavage/methylation domain-containing protein [Massilia polaris]NML60849.1 prepilin-type N-terminal cleavage/methylation domain-containing protein [Massilia polaris]
MTGHSHVWRFQLGVTMIELIAVLIIIGVLGAIASARYFDRASFDADAFANQARSILRYGQKLAVAQNRPVYARVDTDSVELCFEADCNAASRVIAPSGANSGSASTLQHCDNSASWLCEGVPAGVTQTVSGPAASFAFDALGKPNAVNADGTLGNFQRVLVKIEGDGDERSVMVVPETGYVY